MYRGRVKVRDRGRGRGRDMVRDRGRDRVTDMVRGSVMVRAFYNGYSYGYG